MFSEIVSLGFIRVFNTEQQLYDYMVKNPNHRFYFIIDSGKGKKLELVKTGNKPAGLLSLDDLSEWQKHPELYDKEIKEQHEGDH